MLMNIGGMMFDVIFVCESSYDDKLKNIALDHGMDLIEYKDGWTIDEYDDMTYDEVISKYGDHFPTEEKITAFLKQLQDSGEWMIQTYSEKITYSDNDTEETWILAFVHKEVVENALSD